MKTYKSDDFLCIYASCRLVKGAYRSIIYDLDRQNAFHIPNEIFDLLNENNGFNISQTLSKDSIPILSYIDFFLENNLAFIIDENKRGLFPAMSDSFNNPFEITNVIVDVKDNTQHLRRFLNDNTLSVIPNLQIRFLNPVINLAELTSILEIIQHREILYVQIVIHYSAFNSIEDYIGLNKYSKLDVLFVCGVEDEWKFPELKYGVIQIKKTIDTIKHCGVVSYEQFSINIETFTESMHYNSCINRKLSIDINGNIKNCPSMLESFGSINDTTLRQVVERSDFKKKWGITKDEISVCKDCEYRYICTDCRAYVENPENVYSKPLKCGYDPYSGIWKEWSMNPLKQQAIAHYGMKEIIDGH